MSDERLSPVPLGEPFLEALAFAAKAHRTQPRKGTTIPYISHLLSVAALVLEDGGDENQAIAGLLHDVVEDQGGAPMLARVREQFGEEVARIVDGCSDTDQTPKPPWRERKEAHIAHLEDADPAVLRVSLADKVHNSRTLLTDYRAVGDELWRRFNAGRDDQIWYYNELVAVFVRRTSGPLVDEFRQAVAQLTAETGGMSSAV